jgi:phosphatidylglycerol:prolipoprotein diacylglycerol transferase
MLDMVAPFVILAQAIGRWGNFFNGEAYGTITTYERLKEMYIPEFIIKGMYFNGNYYLPLFLFESIWCLLGFIFLLIMRRIKTIRKGQVISLYMMWYSLGRFFIERYRTDSLLVGNIRVAQVVSIALFILGWIILLVQATKKDHESLYNINEKDKIRY